MNKRGFVFVETIVTIVILTSSLLLLYTSFTRVLQSEKTRVYYDDVNYIYRTYYLKEEIAKLNFNPVLDNLQNDNDKYFETIGMGYEDLFLGYESKQNYLASMLEDFEVKQMIILKNNKINNLKKCTLECSLNTNCIEYKNCNLLYLNLDDDFISYLKTINVDIESNYVLVVNYNTCNNLNNCHNFYSWVSV